MVAAVASLTVLATAARVAPAPRRAAGGDAGGRVAPARRHHRQGHYQQQRPQLRRDEQPIVVARADFAEVDADAQSAPGGVAEGRFGPDAILLVGFTPEETKRWRQELDSIEADFVRLVTCTKAMVKGSLGDALETEQEDASAVTSVFGFERMMFFSGMVGGEVMQLIDLWSETGLPQSIFACAVPNNWESKVSDLIEEIVDDHKMMMEKGGAPSQ